ncbi:MAG: hypothetical protein WKG01_05775 [Kofleriaceae bacterium]
MSRLAAALVSLGLVGVTLSPLARDPNDDSFPLSTYPMFARDRPRTLAMPYPLGLTATGTRRYLTPRLVGSGEVLQALRLLEQATRTPAQLAALCQGIATRVRAEDDFRDVVTIQIVHGWHDILDLLVRDRLGPERELVRCGVAR